jgi:NAD(P)H-hydrate epimerase
VSSLINSRGGPLVIDADAINSIAVYARDKKEFFKAANRPLILTPHPLELSRLCGISAEEINKNRELIAERIAREYGVVLLLKGYRTVVTDGETTYVNTTGSSALAKGGSGDCLSGFIASLLASKNSDALKISALAAYLHGKAGDTLSEEYSDFGVTPSDLPKAMAKELAKICKLK